jgi:gliding motility-associated-like protein
VESPANFLAGSISKCTGAQVALIPLNNFEAYIWSNGKDTRSIDVSAPGLYSLEVTDRNGCTGKDSITVIDDICPEYFYVPTAFTPNNDGRNDLFRPRFAGAISNYRFSIYNRWGELVYSSYNAFAGWDGTVQGTRQPVGVYVWICSYSLNGRPTQTEKGTVTLIR